MPGHFSQLETRCCLGEFVPKRFLLRTSETSCPDRPRGNGSMFSPLLICLCVEASLANSTRPFEIHYHMNMSSLFNSDILLRSSLVYLPTKYLKPCRQTTRGTSRGVDIEWLHTFRKRIPSSYHSGRYWRYYFLAWSTVQRSILHQCHTLTQDGYLQLHAPVPLCPHP